MSKKIDYSDEKEIKKRVTKFSLITKMLDNRVESMLNKLVKLTKFDVQKRGELLSTVYINLTKIDPRTQKTYYDKKATYKAYQDSYEDFMHTENKQLVRDEVKFSECFSYCLDDIYYFQMFASKTGCINQIKSLQAQGLNIDNLPEYSKKFFERTAQFEKECNLSDNFDYEKFYNMPEIRKEISRKMRFYFKDIEKIEFNDSTLKNDSKNIESMER